ncbi:SDR family NAD(P)-dependent oxidoreductase [Halomarina salina]|uniref:SDR family NAD(P)-dependent oxidoreductase n=1 Tax=Halomarina salina TaxID=1872699 RepID=A0ABD5RMU9_9EURY|nr:SDR family NAD(P)-dependent oxidoreductase [Halomarina salina]
MTVLVTGGSRGIGRATALTFAAAGEDVVVNYRRDADAAERTVAECEEYGVEAVSVEADVCDPVAVEAMVEGSVDRFGALRAVVSNAGIVRPSRLTETTDEDWRTVLDVNLTGAFYVARAAAPYLQESAGDLVFVSSIGGTAGTVDASYAASKAGLHGLTRALARELGPDGVQVNAVAPGPVQTDLNDDIVAYLEAQGFHGHENVDTHLPEYACTPETVADAIAFLVGNDYVHGEVLALNGGMQFR